MIVQRGGKFVVVAESTGKELGEHNTMAEAQAQLAAIEASKKRRKKGKGK